MAIAAPNRKRRLRESFRHVEGCANKFRCDIIPFIHLSEKHWTLWVDFVPLHRVDETVSNRMRQGFKRFSQSVSLVSQLHKDDGGSVSTRRTNRPKSAILNDALMAERNDIDVSNGEFLNMEIDGDIAVCREDNETVDMSLIYHDKLPSNYRQFSVEPLLSSEDKSRPSVRIVVYRDALRLRTFEFDLKPDTIKAFRSVELVTPPVEPVVEKVDEDNKVSDNQPVTPRVTNVVQYVARPPTASFLRLIKLTKPPREGTSSSSLEYLLSSSYVLHRYYINYYINYNARMQ